MKTKLNKAYLLLLKFKRLLALQILQFNPQNAPQMPDKMVIIFEITGIF